MPTINFFTDSSMFNNGLNKKNSEFDIYTKKVYIDCLKISDSEILSSDMKNVARRKIRKLKEKIAFSVVHVNKLVKEKKATANDLQKTVENFEVFYKLYFSVNDYSLQSFCDNNTSENNKTLFKNMFEIVNAVKKL